MSNFLEKLATGNLHEELDAWLIWMWDMSTPPTDEICEQALAILGRRIKDDGAKKFIEEIKDYMKSSDSKDYNKTVTEPLILDGEEPPEYNKTPVFIDSKQTLETSESGFIYDEKHREISDDMLAELKNEGRK